jgi:3-phenylpropionate/trans-cinnamate dioxygenase ferredoxin subunit
MTEATFHPTLALAEVARGRMRSYKLGEREIVLCHTRDGVFALSNICTHALARMSEGYLKGTRIICPLHGAAFDVSSGRVLGGPATVPLPTYATRVVNGVIEVAIPSGSDPRAPE